MAEHVDVVEKSVEDLEKEITCLMCQGHYTDPKVLPCLHYYCKQCIYKLALKIGLDKPFSCPKCHRDTTLPQGCVDNLPTASFVNHMEKLHSKMERAYGKVDAMCEICSGDKAEAFCQQCAQFICSECIKQHQRMKKIFPGHKVSTFKELKEGGAKEIMQEYPLQKCRKHDELMKMYCFDCNSLICRDCTIKDHPCPEHNCEFVKTAAPEMKKKLIQQLEPLMEVHANYSHAVKEIQTTKFEIEAQGDSVANDIENSFKELQTIIESRKQELLKEAAAKVTEKLECLSVQEKSLSNICAVVQSVIKYTQQSLEHSAEDEVICMHAKLENRIDKEIEEHCKEGRSLDPVEEVDIGVEVSCAEDLKQLCQTKAKVIQLPIDSAKCIMSGDGMKTAEFDKMSEFFVKTKLSNGTDTKLKHHVTCHLKSVVSGSIVEGDVDRIQGNEYRIQYTPIIRGQHELTVSVNGQEVAGSPFSVFVSIPPTRLGKPCRVIDGEKVNFRCIAVNSMGEVVVTGLYNIRVFDRTGTISRCLKSSDYGIDHPFGVAIDSTDCIYITDSWERKIVKLSKDMNLLETYCSDEESKLRGVAVVGEEVMVCDTKNNCIHVYTTELKYVRQIGSPGKDPGEFSGIEDISSDQHGNLYVSDYFNSRIQVLSNGGEFKCVLSSDENKLSGPCGVCVAGQYVYVAGWNSHNISVFTTEGAYVTSFGHKGSNKGDFHNPWGVCVDKDGLVYVCDFNNVMLQLF